MRIRKIELRNHPILSNLELDFTDEHGQSIETIIFAGENGTGKTAILDLLYEFSMFDLSNEKRDEKRIFEIELLDDELGVLRQNVNYKHLFNEGFENGIFTVVFDFNTIGNWNQIKVNFKNAKKELKSAIADFFHQPDIRPQLRCVYSDVEINYTPKQIKSVTAKDLDVVQYQSYKSGENLATEITQLFD
jgi:hypothetical protein